MSQQGLAAALDNFVITFNTSKPQHLQKHHRTIASSHGARNRRKKGTKSQDLAVATTRQPKEPLPHKKQGKANRAAPKESGHGEIADEGKKEIILAVVSSPRADGPLAKQDPFRALPVPSRPGSDVAMVLDYCFRIFSPLYYQTHSIMKIPTPYVTHVFPLMLQNPEAFAAQMSLVSCWINMQRPAEALKKTMNEVLFYRSIAISELRSKLMRPGAYADDATILATMYLLNIDIALQQSDALQAHRTGLQRMVTSRGGLDELGRDGVVKYSLLQCNYSHTRELGFPSLFPAKDLASRKHSYPHHPFNPTLSSLIAPLPQALRELAIHKVLNIDLLEAIAKVNRWTRTLDRSVQHQRVPDDDLDFVTSFNNVDLVDDLLHILANLTSTYSGEGDFNRLLERNICRALVLFMFDVYKSILSQTLLSYQPPRDDLTNDLPKLFSLNQNVIAHLKSKSLRAAQTNTIIWLNLVAASSWKLGTQPPVLLPKGKEVVRDLAQEQPVVKNWTRLEPVLKGDLLWFTPSAVEWRSCLDEALA